MTIKIKNYTASDLNGFINIITQNGYSITFRKGNRLHMMADIKSNDALITNCDDNDDSADEDEPLDDRVERLFLEGVNS